jgi:ATP-dependent protease ClpP protease subunit
MLIGIDGNEIKMYGRIWSGDGPYILSAINPLLQSGEDVTIRLHSPGGSVIDANLVGNAIKSSPSNVHIIVDGIAASMGAILLTKANKVSMASNGLIMVHAPSGFEEGSAKKFEQTAKVLRSMEKDFKANLKARTGQDDNILNDWMVGDNWFDAEEAIDLKLVDEIVDPIMVDTDFTAFRELNIAASLFDARKPSIFDQYDNIEAGRTSSIITTKETVPPTVPPTSQTNNPDTMSKHTIEARHLTLLGLGENATQAEVDAALESQTKQVTDLQAQLAAEKKSKAKALIAQAVAEGKILGSESEAYEKDAEENYDLTARMIAKLVAKPSANGITTPEASTEDNGDARKDWTFDDYRKKDPQALLKLKVSNPTAYATLLANKK